MSTNSASATPDEPTDLDAWATSVVDVFPPLTPEIAAHVARCLRPSAAETASDVA